MIFNYQLKNGIRIIINKTDSLSVAFGVLVGAGSANELKEYNGISHFIEHVNFKGTKNRTAFDISKDSEALGSQINAYTSKNCTVYYIKSLAENGLKSFEILSDLFLNSTYRGSELKKESDVICEEINMYDDTPDDLCTEKLANAYFGDNGYGMPILGSKENVLSFKKRDILAYQSKFYTTDNIVISVSGGVDEKSFLDACKKTFGKIKKSTMADRPIFNKNNNCVSVATDKDIEQIHFALGFSGVSLLKKESDYYAIINNALGGGMSSRLFQEVREKLGFCYSIYSYGTAYLDCGYSVIYAGVNQGKLDDAYMATRDVIKDFKAQGLTQEEFDRNIEQMKAALVYQEESCVSNMIIFGRKMLYENGIFDCNKRLKEFTSITVNEVNDFLSTIDFDNMSKSIVGSGVTPLK